MFETFFGKKMMAVLFSWQVDSYQVHETNKGAYNELWTDVCGHVIQDGELLDVTDSLRLLDAGNADLENVYSHYGMVKFDRCRSRAKSQYSIGPLEGVLIAFAVLIFVVVLLLVIAMCCFAWRYYKKVSKLEKPEPIIYHPPSVYGTLPVGGFAYDHPPPAPPSIVSLTTHDRIYEWQEKSVDMNDGGSLKDYEAFDPTDADDNVLFPQ